MNEYQVALTVSDLSVTCDEFGERFYAAGGVDGIVSDEGPDSTRVRVGMIQQVPSLEVAIHNLAGWVHAADPKAQIEAVEVEPTPQLLGMREPVAAAA